MAIFWAGPPIISLLSNAVFVCCSLSSSPLVVRHPISCAVVICHLCRPLLLSSTIAIVIIRHRRCSPLPSSAAAAVIATQCLCHLLPPVLVLTLCSLPPNLTCRCHPLLLLSAFAVVVCCCHLPLPQPSSPLCCLRRLSPPALVLPHCSCEKLWFYHSLYLEVQTMVEPWFITKVQVEPINCVTGLILVSDEPE
jgi:hypothetical protein